MLWQVQPYLMRRQLKDDVELFGNARYEGYCADLAAKICEWLGIDYELRLVKDTKYGEKMSNGTWNGMVGELTKKVRLQSHPPAYMYLHYRASFPLNTYRPSGLFSCRSHHRLILNIL